MKIDDNVIFDLSKGFMEECEPIDDLPIGLRIYSHDRVYCIASEKDHIGQKIVLASNYDEKYHEEVPLIKYLNDDIRPISEKHGIGNYFDDIDFYTFPEEEVERLIQRAERLQEEMEENRKQKKEIEVERNKKQLSELPEQYPYLTIIPKDSSSKDEYKLFRQNIIAELNQHFPGYKFSLNKYSYNYLTVSWKDGASSNKVEDLLFKFKTGFKNHDEDYHFTSSSNFNKLFGGIEFINCEREISEKLLSLTNSLAEVMKTKDLDKAGEMLYELFEKTNIPPNAVNFRFTIDENSDDYYCLEFDLTDQEVIDESYERVNIRLVDYSEKSFAVYGDTKKIKSELFNLGGRYNRNLREGEGYIFSLKRKSKVEAFLQQLNKTSLS